MSAKTRKVSHFRLKHGGSAYFADPEVLWSDPDMVIFSNDGFYFEINRAVFATISNFTKLLDNAAITEESMAITTDLTKEELSVIMRFVTAGILPLNLDMARITSFAHLGIDLYNLKLTKVPEESVPEFEMEPKESSSLAPKILRQSFKIGNAKNHEDVKLEMEEIYLDPPGDSFKEEGHEDIEDLEELENGETLEDHEDEDFEDFSAEMPLLKGKKKNWYTPKPQVYFSGPRDPEFTFQCPDCNYGTDNHEIFYKHVKSEGGHSAAVTPAFLRQRVYNCILCDELITNEDIVRSHYKKMHNNHCWYCVICGLTGESRRGKVFIRHIKMHFEKLSREEWLKNSVQCVHCGIKCRNKQMLVAHIRRWGKFHTNNCVTCDMPMTSWTEYQEHVTQEHEGRWKYVCGRCDFTTMDVGNLRVHRRTHDSIKKKEFCDICGKGYSNVKAHVEDVHGTDSISCEYCSRIFKHPNSLKRHMSIHYGGKDENGEIKQPVKRTGVAANTSTTCEFCGETSSNSRAATEHYNRYHRPQEERIVQCPVCPKKFFDQVALKAHNYYAHLRSHRCNICEKGYASKSLLDTHTCVTVEKRQCGICGKQMTARRLKLHIEQVHEDEGRRRFPCSECGKGFAIRANLRVHMNIHTNARPYKCRHCDNAFNSMASRNSHEKNIHLKKKQ